MPKNWEEQCELAAKRIAVSQTIALVLPDGAGMEVVGSSSALLASLRTLGKSISLFVPPFDPSVPYGFDPVTGHSPAMVPWAALDGGQEPLREFIISFDLLRSPIKELKYERAENRLDIILSPSGPVRREDVEFRWGELRYDLVVTIGAATPETVQPSLTKAPELMVSKPILNIDSNPANSAYGEINLLAGAEFPRPTLPEIIHQLIMKLGAPAPENDLATALLTALVAATQEFKDIGLRPEAFLLAGELMRRGGDLSLAHRYLSAFMRHGLNQLTARAIARSRRAENIDALIAILTPDDFEKTASSHRDSASIPERILAILPAAGTVALIWRAKAEDPVRAQLASRNAERNAELKRRDGTAAGPGGNTVIAAEFPSFAEAEAEVTRLLLPSSEVE